MSSQNDTEVASWYRGRYETRPRRLILARLGHVEQLYVEVEGRDEWTLVTLPHWRYPNKATVTMQQLREANDTIREYGDPKTTYEAGETNDRHA